MFFEDLEMVNSKLKGIMLFCAVLAVCGCGRKGLELPSDGFDVDSIMVVSPSIDVNSQVVNRRHFDKLLALLNSADSAEKQTFGPDEYIEISFPVGQGRKVMFAVKNGDTYLGEGEQTLVLKGTDLRAFYSSLRESRTGY